MENGLKLNEIMNSYGMWIACSFMMLVLIIQSVLFVKASLKESKNLGMDQQKIKEGIRSAMVTSIGPTVAQIVILMSLIAVVGAPNAWMRINDVGAGRSEIAQVSIGASVFGVEPGAAGYGVEAFSYSLWAMALNNVGWMIMALLCAGKMGIMVEKLNTKYDPKWIKLLMKGSVLGVFGYLLTSNIIGKPNYYILAAVISAIVMLALGKLFGKNQRIQEISLGIAMLCGMLITNAIKLYL